MFSRLKIKTDQQENWDVKHYEQDDTQTDKNLAQEVSLLTKTIKWCFVIYFAAQIAAMAVAFWSHYMIARLKS